MGGGLTGLSSGCFLTRAGFPVSLYESDQAVGGLSRTIEKNGFRFDLGGHRFFTKDREIDLFVRGLMGSELVSVGRSSKIFMRDKYFDYPLKPLNAMFGLGILTSAKILSDFLGESAIRLVRKKEIRSLEDWVISKFGRTMFEIYFKEYSEKVWGIDCTDICATWVDQRIRGLSLMKALKNGLFKFSGKNLATLTSDFLYPALGIGRISDRLREEIEKRNTVSTEARIVGINHDGYRIESISVEHGGRMFQHPADEFVSSIPITQVVSMLNPSPPARVLETASRLRFRDLVIVAVMADRPQITDQTWIYIPEKKIPFGRIHEPTNWSRAMAPPGKSLLVAEFFCFRNDEVWRTPDSELSSVTVENLSRLGFLFKHEVVDSMVVRVPNAYPLFTVGYGRFAEELSEYLAGFSNLHIAGRSGMFQYYNMDLAIRSGMETAEKIIRSCSRDAQSAPAQMALAGT